MKTIAIIALIWGIAGGWSILGQWFPAANELTKDTATIMFAIALFYGRKAPEK